MRYRWPVAECLHEHRQEQESLMMFQFERPVHIIPAWCPECGYEWPIED